VARAGGAQKLSGFDRRQAGFASFAARNQ
jgi:hypothetical protein